MGKTSIFNLQLVPNLTNGGLYPYQKQMNWGKMPISTK
jgi:hypothetical protein